MKITDNQLDELLKSEENHSFDKTFTYRSDPKKTRAKRANNIQIKRIILFAAIFAAVMTAFVFSVSLIKSGSDTPAPTVTTDTEIIDTTNAADKVNATEIIEKPNMGKDKFDEEPSEDSVPSWYAPGKLSVVSLTLKPSDDSGSASAVEGYGGSEDGAPEENLYRNIAIEISGDPDSVMNGLYINSNNAIFALSEENMSNHVVGSYYDDFLIVNTITLDSCRCKGKLLSSSDGLLVTRLDGTYHVYDSEKCAETTPAGDIFAFDMCDGELLRVNVSDGSKKIIRKTPDAWFVSADGSYLFTYVSGEDHLCCYGKNEGEMFEAKLSVEFTDFINGIEDGKKAVYGISANSETDEILIYCSYTDK